MGEASPCLQPCPSVTLDSIATLQNDSSDRVQGKSSGHPLCGASDAGPATPQLCNHENATIFQIMPKRNTKINLSFPQCLIKQWINNSIDKYPNALQICDKEFNIKRKEAHNIFFEKNQYTQNTETQTSKDDDLLFKYIREIETADNINENAKIFQDISFLQLTYKLLCRTKTINDLFVKGTYENLTFAKDLYSPEKTLPNGFIAYKLLRQTVNFHLLVEGNDDWAKIDYHFMVNHTNKRFVLADNIKDKLILSLSPNLCVGYSSNKQNGGRVSVFTHEIEDEGFIVKLNKSMLDGGDKFVVFYQKSDLGVV